MHEGAGILVETLEEAARSGQQVNLYHRAVEMTLDVLGSSAFGVKFDNQVIMDASRIDCTCEVARWVFCLVLDVLSLTVYGVKSNNHGSASFAKSSCFMGPAFEALYSVLPLSH
jgi:hypothetical protein